MKCFVYVLAAVLFLAACEKKETAPPVKSPYPDVVVGVVEDGGFELQNESLIKQEWQKRAAAGLNIISLEIEKSVSVGDARVEFYMLVAKTGQGVQLAALLDKKEGKLFFNTASGIVTSCKSIKGEKFTIHGNSNEGHIRLFCDDCVECEKVEASL